MTSQLQRCSCSCCGYETISQRIEWEICRVCYWEDYPLPSDDPDFAGGANALSLNDAKKAYRQQFPT